MAGRRRTGGLIATTAVLTLPLWLGSCTPGPAPSAGGVPAGITAVEPMETPGAVPIPAPPPQAPPPPVAASTETGTATLQFPNQQSPSPAGRAGTPETGSSTGQAPAAGTGPGAG